MTAMRILECPLQDKHESTGLPTHYWPLQANQKNAAIRILDCHLMATEDAATRAPWGELIFVAFSITMTIKYLPLLTT